MAKHVYIDLDLSSETMAQPSRKAVFYQKSGLLYNKNRFLITLLITVQNFRQSFSPRKKDTSRNIFSALRVS